jgi:predicted phage-related endonuclease
MIDLKLKQGTDEWLQERRKYITASNVASAMNTDSYHRYLTQSQLATNIINGEQQESNEFKERLFAEGHEFEALARPKIEDLLGQELFPVSATDNDGVLMASFDGLTLDNKIVWEHKLYNANKEADLQNGVMPKKDYWQIIQQLYISGAEQLIYTLSDENNIVSAVITKSDFKEKDLCFDTPYWIVIDDIESRFNELSEKSFEFIDNIENLQEVKATGFLKARLDDYFNQKQMVDEAVAKLDDIKKEVIAKVEEQGLNVVYTDEVKMQKITRKGGINWAKYQKENGLEIDKEYQKADTEYWGFR